jgi:OOP family OmpA-OmpF porin
MKKFLVSIVALTAFALNGSAQNTDYIRPKALAVSFTLNDFETASRIRSQSLSSVLNNKQWAKLKDMTPGIAITYFKGLRNHVDFAATVSGSFVNIQLEDHEGNAEDFLLETDASLNLKMFPDNYVFTPYLNVGVGASVYDGKLGAFIPLGGGFKFNLFNEAAIFINSQYRVPVTTSTSAYHFFHSIGIAGTIGK